MFNKCYQNDNKDDKMHGACGTQTEERAYKFLVGKPEGRTPLGQHRHRQDNSKTNLKEKGWEYV